MDKKTLKRFPHSPLCRGVDRAVVPALAGSWGDLGQGCSAPAWARRVATVTMDTLALVDGSLNSTTNYYYRVSATYLSWSAPSPVSQVTTLNKQCR